MGGLTTRASENLTDVLACYDRIVITGTLPGACFADGMGVRGAMEQGTDLTMFDKTFVLSNTGSIIRCAANQG